MSLKNSSKSKSALKSCKASVDISKLLSPGKCSAKPRESLLVLSLNSLLTEKLADVLKATGS